MISGGNSRKKKEIFYLTEKIDVPEQITTKDYVLVYGALYGLNKQRTLVRMMEALELFGLGSITDCKLSHLSQGQRRMVQLSVAYILQRKV
ncbi:MAG: hypothetical protein PWQ40_2062 [Archaeoglobus sp.]|uniref:ABC-type multidrug transport system, ATPase component n=1 Tax=Archaeoglobus fulgidus DSM 8774 TaxID=1344584 RepID=A0A075WKS8_ARCFL|nr:hypothetical protein AFULGI_00013770 [Archaeoglobus fulgidus DSM 8774]MDI3498693.1 hypothetical protein [Archaeoglobus sp.]